MRKKKKLSALLICSCELGKRSISFSLVIPQFIFSLGLSQPPRWNVTQSIILPRLARLLVVWFDGCRLQWPCLCSSGLPGGLPLSHLQHPAASLGPSPRALLDHSSYLLTCPIFLFPILRSTLVSCRLLFPKHEACPLSSVGVLGSCSEGVWARTAATGIPASIPGSSRLGLAGCCLTNLPPIQLPNLISHINKGLNWLHFYSRCANLTK